MSVEERFWAKANAADKDACWEWSGSRNEKGYGKISASGSLSYAHRVSVELDGREIPDGFVVDHLCSNPPCVNPAHLEAVPQSVNLMRGKRKTEQTHCKRGHEFNEANTYRDPIGRRHCRACDREVYRFNKKKAHMCGAINGLEHSEGCPCPQKETETK